MRTNSYAGIILFLMLIFFSSPIVWAQSGDTEIDGLIIDQSRSKTGHDFVEEFSISWETVAHEYNIVISDQTDARAGSWVSIEINGELVFKALLKPSAEEIENLVSEAVADCNSFLDSQNEANRNLEQEKDMKGSGI